MPLNTVVTGNTILASDLNQVINVLQRAAGQTETGSYFLHGWGGASGDTIAAWVPSESRGATPVSVSIDTSIQAASSVNAPATANLNANGFQVFTGTSAATTSGQVGGAYTIQY